jgi:hypothetical protein
MPNEKFTQLPIVANATLSDIICAVQAGVSVQETLSQVQQLMLSNTILTYPGNPNGNLAGSTYQLCWDTVDSVLYICTVTGTSLTAVWTQTGLNVLVTPAQGGTGVSNPVAHSIAIAEGSSHFNFLTLDNGQLPIGSTGLDPVVNTITAGTNISIVNGPGSITISSTGAASFTWNLVTGTSQAMVSNNGYVADNSGLVTLTLPTTSNFGDMIRVVGMGTGGWSVDYGASQIIHFGNVNTTVTTGSISSTGQYDSFGLLCSVANTEWIVFEGPEGNLTYI